MPQTKPRPLPDWSKFKTHKCKICKTSRQYTNPMVKCWECSKFFCFDHINGGMVNEKMKDNETIRDICFKCTVRKNYKSIGAVDKTHLTE